MAYTVIVEKTSNRVVYIQDADLPIVFETLWPPVSHHYHTWSAPIASDIEATPWNFLSHWPGFITSLVTVESEIEAYILQRTRAHMLLQLAKTTNAYRRVAFKNEPFAQEVVYALKTEEAQKYLSKRETMSGLASSAIIVNLEYPFLTDEAAHDSISLFQAATLIMFRHTQQRQILQASEQKRRYYTRQILSAVQPSQLADLQQDLNNYEQRA
jgi:hypothetical protein